MSGPFEALSLLTRIPARSSGDLKGALPWFPVIGGVIGLAVAGVYAASLLVLPALVAALLATGAGILLTGALHEDGLADTADAFGMRFTRERTVEILKDPRLGTYGVAALVLSIGLRASVLASLNEIAALAALPAAHALGRTSSLAATRFAPMSSNSTLGTAYAYELGLVPSAIAGLSAVAMAVGMLGLWGLIAFALAIIVAASVARTSRRRIGGLTGDLFGAAEQITEIGVLLLACAVRQHIPWWLS